MATTYIVFAFMLFSLCAAHHGHHGWVSEEHHLDLMEARVDRCVKDAVPHMIAGGTYTHQYKIDICVSDGLDALEAGKAPPAVAQQIKDCVLAKPFPDYLMHVVRAFVDCVVAALP